MKYRVDFPAETIRSQDLPRQMVTRTIQVATALQPSSFSQHASKSDLLQFRAGERIIVEGRDGDWLLGSIGATRKGWLHRDMVAVEEHKL